MGKGSGKLIKIFALGFLSLNIFALLVVIFIYKLYLLFLSVPLLFFAFSLIWGFGELIENSSTLIDQNDKIIEYLEANSKNWYCSDCGQENDWNAKFCSECGCKK
jgi:hypothetical protein